MVTLDSTTDIFDCGLVAVAVRPLLQTGPYGIWELTFYLVPGNFWEFGGKTSMTSHKLLSERFDIKMKYIDEVFGKVS